MRSEGHEEQTHKAHCYRQRCQHTV